MTPRYVSQNLVGAAAMLAFGATIAFAQDTTKTVPRSQRRIPISKEGPGAAPRVDTVTQTVYKTDTLRVQGRTDTVTVRVAGPATTMTVHDTVTLQPVARAMRLPGGLYFGIAGGVSAPNKVRSSFRTVLARARRRSSAGRVATTRSAFASTRTTPSRVRIPSTRATRATRRSST